MFKMYELNEMYSNVWELAGDETADLESLEVALKNIEASIESKAENTAKLIKNMDAHILALKEEEKRLAGKRRALENKQGNIKSYLEYQLLSMDINKVETDLFTVALQNNPPSVKFTDETLIPDKYKHIVTTVNIPKKAILDDLKAGAVVAGAEIVQSKSLRIR